ncbi:AraC family transcriptional regulator [Maribacter sp. 2308TA10-17]|uniref:AraC family transcriptional regulator n=1 Tax=Maribacter sp. 2308TA10-17 TaxID=3386276 RepID=UPI0039BD0E79
MTKRYFSRHSLNIFSLERTEWGFPIHGHNFYELIVIESGNGIQVMNDVSFPYKKGDIFLLTPNDEHYFEIEEKTRFTFVKFTEQIFTEKNEGNSSNAWQKKIDTILFNPNTLPGPIISSEEEKSKILKLLALLKVEYEMKDVFSRHLVLDLFDAMITVIARCLNERNKTLTYKETADTDRVSSVLTYIRQHILEKEKLSINAIADEFFMSPNYVGIFIKKHTGMSIQQVVMETKLKTAERLLASSKLTISEIANRLQFTDSSHFTKTFKKYRNKTPKVFRKEING